MPTFENVKPLSVGHHCPKGESGDTEVNSKDFLTLPGLLDRSIICHSNQWNTGGQQTMTLQITLLDFFYIYCMLFQFFLFKTIPKDSIYSKFTFLKIMRYLKAFSYMYCMFCCDCFMLSQRQWLYISKGRK